MKCVFLLAMLLSSAAAFTAPTMTFAVSKKAPAKKKAVAKKVVAKKVVVKPKPAPKKVVAVKKAAPPPKKVVSFSSKSGTVPSAAIPGEEAPAILDGSLVGDVGFDPCFLSTKADLLADYFNGLFNGRTKLSGLEWYREAELMHGRICMVAVLGFIVPGFGTFSGNEWTGLDAYSETNPLAAWGAAPSAALFQIFAFMSMMELRRVRLIDAAGPNYVVGNAQNWGQGGWNPFGLDYTPAEYEEKQLQEVKHARLAMIGLLGLIFQANASGVNVVEQWSTAFNAPVYYEKAGYFFPEGI